MDEKIDYFPREHIFHRATLWASRTAASDLTAARAGSTLSLADRLAVLVLSFRCQFARVIAQNAGCYTAVLVPILACDNSRRVNNANSWAVFAVNATSAHRPDFAPGSGRV